MERKQFGSGLEALYGIMASPTLTENQKVAIIASLLYCAEVEIDPFVITECYIRAKAWLKKELSKEDKVLQ